MSKQEDARRRLMEFIPHLMVAANMASMQQPGSQVCLAVVSRNQEGEGALTAAFECQDFSAT